MKPIVRSNWSVLGWALVSVLCAAASMAASGTLARPNVIVISLDTLRADHLSLYGYGRETSPSLDAFAEHAVVFRRAIAQSNSTIASHRSLFQSKYPSVGRRNSTMLAEILVDAGYRTAGFTGGGNVSAAFGFGRGFEVYDEHEGGLEASLPLAQRWLDDVGGAAFFLFLHTYEIHLPYDPPPPYDTMFYPEYDGKVTGEGSRELLRRFRRMGEYKEIEAPNLSPTDRKKVVALYDGGIRSADQQLARLFTELEERKLLESSLVVILSDHGEEFWDHDSVIHSHTLFQELLHVPLIMRFPARAHADTQITSMASLLDVSPTILDFLDLPVSASFAGRSMLPVIRGSDSSHRKVLSEGSELRSWIDHPWKLIKPRRGKDPSLFNLEHDSSEQRNLHRDQPERVEAMSAEIRAAVGKGSDLSRVKELEDGDIDEELEKRLRVLGYIE